MSGSSAVVSTTSPGLLTTTDGASAELQAAEGQVSFQLPAGLALTFPTKPPSSPVETDDFLNTRTTALGAAVPAIVLVVAAVTCGASTPPWITVELPGPAMPMSMNWSPLPEPVLRANTFDCGAVPPP